MRAIDTNVLVRLLVKDDEAELRAARAFVEEGAWISHLVIAEAIWVLDGSYERSPDEIADAIERLLGNVALTVEEPRVGAAATNSFRRTRGVSFSDCLILETARKAGHVPLGTFDRKLARLDDTIRL